MQQKARHTKGRLAELAELTESAGTRVTKAGEKKKKTHIEKVTKTRQNDEDHTRGIMPETSRGGRDNLPVHKGRTCIGAHRHTQTDRRGRQWDNTGETHQGGANNQKTGGKVDGGKTQRQGFQNKTGSTFKPRQFECAAQFTFLLKDKLSLTCLFFFYFY